MYNIMIAQSKRDNYASLYQFLTSDISGEISPLELKTKEELDERIEKMLNEDGYAKSDFIVVQVIDYTVDATSYSDDTVNSDSDDPQTT